MSKRSFTKLKKSMLFDDFNNFCKKITEEYAISDNNFARSYFCNRYDISEACYYKILEYAVVTNLVSERIVTKMRDKALGNQKSHNANAGSTTYAKYAKMYEQRCKYIACTFTDDEVKELAEEYANHPELTKYELAQYRALPVRVLEEILVRSIEGNIINDETFASIQKRCIKAAKKERLNYVKDFFAGLQKKRTANKNGVTIES